MKSAKWVFMLFSLLVVLSVPNSVSACAVPSPRPSPTPVLVRMNGPNINLSYAVNLFEISTTHDCVCGLGVGMTGATGPGSLVFTNVSLQDSGGNILAQFNFMPNGTTTMGLANGPVITPGARWFGFNASVNPFPLPADGLAFLVFSGTINQGDINALNGLMAQFAAGVGSGPNPVFDPNDPHGVKYDKTSLENVPEPISMFLLGTGLAGVAMKIRRSRKRSGT